MTWNIARFYRSLLTRSLRRRPCRRKARRRLAVEELEPRLAPAIVSWAVDTSGNWNVGSDWSTGSVPGANDTAVINRLVPVTVTIDSNQSVGGLQTGAQETLLLTGGANVTLAGTVTNNGTIEAKPSSAGGVTVQFSGNVMLGGTGQLLMDPEVSGNYVITYATAGSTVTNAAGHTVRSVGVGYFGAYNEGTVVNQGTLEADGAGHALLMYPTLISNQGTLQVNNGATVYIASASTTLDNTGGQVSADGGTLNLENATLKGGTLDFTNGSTLVSNGGTVSNVTNAAGSDLIIPGGNVVTLAGTITDNGTIEVQPNSTGGVTIPFSGSVTLAGTGVMQFDPEVGSNYVVTHPTQGSSVTNAPGHTVRSVGVGYFGAFNEGTVINQGVLEADGAGHFLQMYPALITNRGTIQASNGGTVSIVSASTTLDNTGGTVHADNGTLYNLGTVTGGALDFVNGSQLYGDGTLDGVTIPADSQVTLAPNADLTLKGTITNDGVISATGGSLNNPSLTVASGSVTLAGTGQLILNRDPVSGNPAIVSVATGATLTNAAGHTVRGAGYFGAYQAGTVVNQGLIEADVAGDGLTIYTTAASNSGTLEAVKGATLGVAERLDNTGGLIHTDAGFLQTFSGSAAGTVVGGTLDLTNGSQLVGFGVVNGTALAADSKSTLSSTATLNNIAILAGLEVNLTPGFNDTFTGTLTVDGNLNMTQNAVRATAASVEMDGSGVLAMAPSATLAVQGNLLGDTNNADQVAPQGTVVLNGSGTAAAPQLLEVMSQDLGPVASGFIKNFAFGTLALGARTYVRLVDNARNSSGTGAEALYVNALIVPSGSTLDLNSLHVYARTVQVAGTVLGGTITLLPSGGAIALNHPAAGTLANANAVDSWTFFGRAAEAVSVVVNTGNLGLPTPLPPSMNYAQVQLLDATGHVLATSSNTQSGADATLLGVSLPADGVYQVQVQAPASHPGSNGNYDITVWDATVHDATLNLGETVTGQLASPYATDRWTFSASANQQIRFNLVNASTSAVQFSLTGPNGYTAFSGRTTSSDLITLPETGSYVLTVQDPLDQTGAFAFRLDETPLTALALNTSYQGTLAGSGQPQLFTVPLTSPTSLSFLLTDANVNDENEVYVSLGSAPTRDHYQYRFTTTGANQTVLVPGQPGTYYVLVYNNLVTAPGSKYTLGVQGGPFALAGVTPGQVGDGQAATLLVTGLFPLEYQSATAYQVQFVAAGGTLYPSAPLYLSPTSLSNGQNVTGTTTMAATLPAGALPAGTYSVRVSDSLGNTQTLANALTVTAGGTGILKTRIILPGAIGYHAPSTLYVQYTNVGTAPMTAPLLVFTATRGGQQGAFLSLDPSLAGIDHVTDTTPAGYSQTVQFLAGGAVPGILEPGESVTVPVYYGGWRQSQWNLSGVVLFSVGELDTTNSQTIDWSNLRNELPWTGLSSDGLNQFWKNMQNLAGTTWGQFIASIDPETVNSVPYAFANSIDGLVVSALYGVTADTLPSASPQLVPMGQGSYPSVQISPETTLIEVQHGAENADGTPVHTIFIVKGYTDTADIQAAQMVASQNPDARVIAVDWTDAASPFGPGTLNRANPLNYELAAINSLKQQFPNELMACPCAGLFLFPQALC